MPLHITASLLIPPATSASIARICATLSFIAPLLTMPAGCANPIGISDAERDTAGGSYIRRHLFANGSLVGGAPQPPPGLPSQLGLIAVTTVKNVFRHAVPPQLCRPT